MINYDTIKSVYDDKLTLMQWLDKVQEALKDATAVSFNVNKRGDATLTFSILFDDGTELETDPIIIEQGESVESATLRNGHLILTLTNGDELDAGNMGAVSSFSIDANQHLIVTYQDGSTSDLGAIFAGNVTINGDLTAVNIRVNSTLKTDYIEPKSGSAVNVSSLNIPNGNVTIAQGNLIIGNGNASIHTLTSSGDEISAQKPVVEVMTGYGANVGTDIAQYFWSFTPSYVSACKNGNKLTLAAFFKLKKIPASSEVYIEVINFTIPYAIANLIESITIGGYGYVDQKEVACFYGPSNYIKCPIRMSKSGNVLSLIIDTTNFVVDTDYLIRYEATFLLSPNLIS